MFYTAAWCTDNERKFRDSLPLELLGESIQRYGPATGCCIVMLEGIELLSENYLNSLKQYGFTVIDYCSAFRDIIASYENINRNYSKYARNCFLRWIAFKEIFRKNFHHDRQFWHVDSDIMLHTSLDDLAKDTSGKTFMLQGCPVLVSVSDPSWFEIYEENLKAFNDDIKGYSERAFAGKKEAKKSDLYLVNHSVYANPFVHDQDLLEYLVSGKKLMQDNHLSVYDSRYYFIQNPLAVKIWHKIQYKGNATFEINENFEIIIGDKLVPFMHYQNTFSSYAEIYMQLRKLHIPGVLIKRLLAYRFDDDDNFSTTLFYKAAAKFNYKLNHTAGRGNLIKKFGREKYRVMIAELLNFLLQE